MFPLFIGDKFLGVVNKIIILLLFTFLLLILLYLITFSGEGVDLWVVDETIPARIAKVEDKKSAIDLTKVESDQLVVENYEGASDPLQQAMAKEILKIIDESISKQRLLLDKFTEICGDEKEARQYLMYLMLGTHVSESGTYAGAVYRSIGTNDTDPYLPGYKKTYILKNYVKWSDYNKGKTATGQTMNFTNYSWKDFNLKYKNEGGNSSNRGLNYGLVSVANALGPLQIKPSTFYGGRGTGYIVNNVITDVEKFMESPDGGKYDKYDYNNDTYSDIYNYGDQVMNALNYYYNLLTQYILRHPSLGLTDEKDLRVLMANIIVAYHRGEGNFLNEASTKPEVRNETYRTLLHDEELQKRLYTCYKENMSIGVTDKGMIKEAFKKVGWTESGEKNLSKDGVTIREEYWLDPLRRYYTGYSWYLFLNGVAYGTSSIGYRPEGLNKVTYNYMTGGNSERNSQRDIRENTTLSSPIMALGFKGPYPIYDQGSNQPPFNRYYMLNSGGSLETFGSSACTVFTATSMIIGLGKEPTIWAKLDRDGNGSITPLEVWQSMREALGRGTYPINSVPPKGTSVISIRGALSALGYQVAEVTQGWNYDNNKIIEALKSGIPVHIRIENGRRISGYYPKEPPNRINYSNFDMYDIENNYIYKDSAKGEGVKLTDSGHSVLGVNYLNYKGKDYISIVNSTSHHFSYDTNLVWFDAKELLADVYTNSYFIIGSKNDPNWKPGVTSSGYDYNSVPKFEYEGSFIEDFLEELNTKNDLIDPYIMRLTGYVEGHNEGIVTITTNKQYVVESLGNDGIRVYIGKSDTSSTIVDIEGVYRTYSSERNEEGKFKLFDLEVGKSATLKYGIIRHVDNEVIYSRFFNDYVTE